VLPIKDNGLGIAMKKFGDKLFQMYKTFHHKKASIGTGLFVIKKYIESLGGKVTAISKVGVDSEFSIYLKNSMIHFS
jgi:signal transduction histidine kinase